VRESSYAFDFKRRYIFEAETLCKTDTMQMKRLIEWNECSSQIFEAEKSSQNKKKKRAIETKSEIEEKVQSKNFDLLLKIDSKPGEKRKKPNQSKIPKGGIVMTAKDFNLIVRYLYEIEKFPFTISDHLSVTVEPVFCLLGGSIIVSRNREKEWKIRYLSWVVWVLKFSRTRKELKITDWWWLECDWIKQRKSTMDEWYIFVFQRWRTCGWRLRFETANSKSSFVTFGY
jgi:hypothetical protein